MEPVSLGSVAKKATPDALRMIDAALDREAAIHVGRRAATADRPPRRRTVRKAGSRRRAARRAPATVNDVLRP
jgi:hypothetical protein